MSNKTGLLLGLGVASLVMMGMARSSESSFGNKKWYELSGYKLYNYYKKRDDAEEAAAKLKEEGYYALVFYDKDKKQYYVILNIVEKRSKLTGNGKQENIPRELDE